jgi:hypothetical protein
LGGLKYEGVLGARSLFLAAWNSFDLTRRVLCLARKGKVVGGDLFQYIRRFGKQVLFVCSDVPGSFRAVVFS